MIYIQLHRFVNDCVKIDIILVLAKKTAQEYNPIRIEYFGSREKVVSSRKQVEPK